MPLAGAGTASVGRVAADALRWQRNLALLIVVTPMLGVLGAGYLAYTSGVSIIDIALLLVMYVASVIGVEAGFHRHFTHRAFAAHPTVRALLAILGSTAAQGPVLFWAAMHREHHAHSDRPGDPHSPRASSEGVMAAMRGLCHAHVLWLFKPLPQDFAARVPDLLRDGFVFRLHRNYPWWVILGLVLPALLGGLLTQSWRGALSGFLWGGLVRVFLVHHATWSVNSLCHSFGSRPFNTGDRSTNNPLLVLSSLGGCWHNNHHAFPTLARLDFRWWQLDICGWFIRLLQIAGLAWNVRVVDKRTLGLRATTDATKRQGESP
ncbi:MAG: acyl-CoA desaturase [Gammaproteobacteria bacterium]|nr:acyl-CoA desaturase [Gammaproteobacteria bacterium]